MQKSENKMTNTNQPKLMLKLGVYLSACCVMLNLTACSEMALQRGTFFNKTSDTLKEAAVIKPVTPQAPPSAVNQALLPPLKIALPKLSAKQLEQRFDLVINNAPANQVLMGIVSGTRYSMLLHPDVKGTISLNLKDVTVFDVLDSLRDLYGYEYKLDGTRIMVQMQSIQTRVFQVNYIVGQRKGSSDTRVTSGSVSSGSGASSTSGSTTKSTTGGNGAGQVSTSIQTTSNNDFWKDLGDSLTGIVGSEEGRRVIVNAQSGVIVVRAMPSEVRNVESFLHLMQVNIERQVILEAKILNVQLNSQSQSGVNWSIFGRSNRTTGTIGSINPNTQLSTSGNLTSGSLSTTTGSVLANNNSTTALGGPLFAVALQSANFAALLSFLETQGDIQVLSSPRIATINNQKAVLKVGTDEFFVTGVSSSTTASTGATTTVPEVTLQPFFSGISLDVTPQIDRDDNIILHIHPSISQVSTVNKQVSLGTNLSQINLPLASSNISETDSIVRTRDGSVIAIGGLMTENTANNTSKIPGLGDIKGLGSLFKQNGKTSTKTELVLLLKATVVQGESSWSDDILTSQKRVQSMQTPSGNGVEKN